MNFESAARAVRTGLIAFAFLIYLFLIGIPGRIGGTALPILALVAALFFWFKLRREAAALSAREPDRKPTGFAGKPGWQIGTRGESTGKGANEGRSAEIFTIIVSSGLLASATTGLLIAIVSGICATAIGNGISIQPVFDKVVPINVAALIGVSPGDIARAQVAPFRLPLADALLRCRAD